MKKLKFGLCLLFLPLFFAGCKKTESEPDPQPALPQIDVSSPLISTLSSRGWMLISAKDAFGNEQINTDYFPCEVDNIFYFKSDYSYIILEGATKCDSLDPDTVETGFWRSLNKGTLFSPNFEILFNVVKLDTARFHIKGNDAGEVIDLTFKSVP